MVTIRTTHFKTYYVVKRPGAIRNKGQTWERLLKIKTVKSRSLLLPFSAQHSVEIRSEGVLSFQAVLSWFKSYLTSCVLWSMAHPLLKADRSSNGLSGMARLERKQGQRGQRRWCLGADGFSTFWLKVLNPCWSNCLWEKIGWNIVWVLAQGGPVDFFHGVPSWLVKLASISRGRCVLLLHSSSSYEVSEYMQCCVWCWPDGLCVNVL